ncbi:MAG: nucleoside phosphorylase [Negativicutes bacterium]|jgi:uridine phosphorylase
MKKDFPILEYDHNHVAVITPRDRYRPVEHDGCAVLCFFWEVLRDLQADGRLEVLATSPSECGPIYTYLLRHKNRKLLVQHPGMSAPFGACVLEVLIAMGSKRIIACGGAGVLKKEIASGHLIVPNSAVRDEGTSYHYQPAAREIAINRTALRAITNTLDEHQCPYVVGKTWTTDALFRETPAKVARRREEGCITVEMECSAFAAVAQFRGVTFGQILYGGDDVSCELWDSRDWENNIVAHASVREKLFWLAVEAALAITE